MRADLTTTYLGLSLKNPIVASAGPLTGELDTLRRLEQQGVSAAVLPSLFEEQICRDEQFMRCMNFRRTHRPNRFHIFRGQASLVRGRASIWTCWSRPRRPFRFR